MNFYLAYIDPGSGSYIVQLILAGLLGIGYTLKLYWYKIVSFFKRSPEKKNKDK